MFRDVKVVFQDLDGCINTPDGSDLSSAAEGGLTREQARLLGEIGRAIDASPVEQVVLNTGRTLSAVGYIADAIGSDKIRYWLTEHAAHGFDAFESRELDLPELARRAGLHDRAERYAGLARIAAVIDWYHEHGHQRLSERLGVPLPALRKAANLTVAVPDGVPGAELIGALEQLLEETPEIDSEGLLYHHNPYYVDVLCQVGKGDGALLMLGHLGISKVHALAAGDGLNDVSMFEVLDRGFCPANADLQLQQVCRSKGGVVSTECFGAATIALYRSLR